MEYTSSNVHEPVPCLPCWASSRCRPASSKGRASFANVVATILLRSTGHLTSKVAFRKSKWVQTEPHARTDQRAAGNLEWDRTILESEQILYQSFKLFWKILKCTEIKVTFSQAQVHIGHWCTWQLLLVNSSSTMSVIVFLQMPHVVHEQILFQFLNFEKS